MFGSLVLIPIRETALVGINMFDKVAKKHLHSENKIMDASSRSFLYVAVPNFSMITVHLPKQQSTDDIQNIPIGILLAEDAP